MVEPHRAGLRVHSSQQGQTCAPSLKPVPTWALGARRQALCLPRLAFRKMFFLRNTLFIKASVSIVSVGKRLALSPKNPRAVLRVFRRTCKSGSHTVSALMANSVARIYSRNPLLFHMFLSSHAAFSSRPCIFTESASKSACSFPPT